MPHNKAMSIYVPTVKTASGVTAVQGAYKNGRELVGIGQFPSDIPSHPQLIETHLTVVFTALAIARRMQAVNGMTVKRIIQRLSVFRTAVISLKGGSHRIPAHISAEAVALFIQLSSRGCCH
jgi:hypothetical protein